MTNEFDEVMAQRTNAELIAILNSPEGDYQPAAIEAAKRIFDSRHLSDQQILAVNDEIHQKRQVDELKANEPLEFKYKLIALVLPFIGATLSLNFEEDGYTRKMKEMELWSRYRYALYVIIVLFIIFIEVVSNLFK